MDGLFLTTLIAIHGVLALGLGAMSNGDVAQAKSLRLFQLYFLLLTCSWTLLYLKGPHLDVGWYKALSYIPFFLSYEFLLTAVSIHSTGQVRYHKASFIPLMVVLYLVLSLSGSQASIHVTDTYQCAALLFCWIIASGRYSQGGNNGDLYLSRFFLFGALAFSSRSIYVLASGDIGQGFIFSSSVFTVVNIGICLSIMVSHFLEVKARLEQEANTDSLTGIYNRRYFNAVADRIHALSVRHHEPYSILICDIDHFKLVNDTYGHTAGDISLKQVANMLLKGKRAEDTLARYGGEEFIFILPSTHAQDAELLAERIRTMVETNNIIADAATFTLTMSFGIAQFYPNYTSRQVIDEADAALLKAKSAGRNGICVSERGVLRASELYRQAC